MSEEIPQPKPIVIEETIEDALEVQKSERAREEAEQAKPFEWNGVKLHPFAIDRQTDWITFCLAMNYEGVKNLLDGTLAQGKFLTFANDAQALIWFCSVDPEEWVGCSWKEVDAKIRAWKRENIQLNQMAETTALGFEIFNRAHATQAAIKPSVGTSLGKI